jgi:hypothetical protein
MNQSRRFRWLALGLIAVAIVGIALWIRSPWANRAPSPAVPATDAAPAGPPNGPALVAVPETSAMLKMARAAFDACGAPQAPHDIPDGATATRDQMVSAHATVKAFDEATTIYNQCVDTTAYQASIQFKTVATSAETETLNSLQVHLHNEAIDRDRELANRFNVQLRRFKARAQK